MYKLVDGIHSIIHLFNFWVSTENYVDRNDNINILNILWKQIKAASCKGFVCLMPFRLSRKKNCTIGLNFILEVRSEWYFWTGWGAFRGIFRQWLHTGRTTSEIRGKFHFNQNSIIQISTSVWNFGLLSNFHIIYHCSNVKLCNFTLGRYQTFLFPVFRLVFNYIFF